jgi:hypothetical protein
MHDFVRSPHVQALQPLGGTEDVVGRVEGLAGTPELDERSLLGIVEGGFQL